MAENPLPEGWLDEYVDKADLDLSYSRLTARRHFYVEALRGHIRSQQLRFEDAWDHFDKATLFCAESEENIPNLVRQFLLHIWCFENALVEAPLADGDLDVPVLWIPELPERILADYPEVKLVIDHRRNAEALLRLHIGKWSESAELYQTLIQENRNSVHNDSLATYYLGMAACQHNMDMKEIALRYLEDAGLSVLTGGRTLNRLLGAAVLYAMYSRIGDLDEARSWKSFLESFKCPQPTKEVILRRADILIERCAQKESLVLF
jgi:hypothetical protein